MANTNNTVNTVASNNVAVDPIATTKVTPKSVKPIDNTRRNSTKADGQRMTEVAVEHFKDLGAASKVINDLISDVGEGLHNNSMTRDQLKARFDRAQSEVKASLDRLHRRAEIMRDMPRGTTGVGGFTFETAVTAMWRAMSKSKAIESVKAALKTAGLIK